MMPGWPNVHISGPDKGKLAFPASLTALVLDGVPDGAASKGAINVDDLTSAAQTAPQAPAAPPPSPPRPPGRGRCAQRANRRADLRPRPPGMICMSAISTAPTFNGCATGPASRL